MSLLAGWKTFEFFTTIKCGTDHHNGASPAHIDAVETWDDSRACTKHDDDGWYPGQGVGTKQKETFWVGTVHGMVHCLEAPAGGGVVPLCSPSSYRCVRSFPAFDGMSVGYIERIVSRRRTLLVVVGSCRGTEHGYSVVLTCWDVSDEESLEVLPTQVASVSVFRSLKLPDATGLECMDVDCKEWPRVTIGVGTELGGVYVYSCADVVSKRSAFSSLGSMDVLKKRRQDGRGGVTNVHIFRPNDSGMYVFGVTEGEMAGFDVIEGRVVIEDQVGAARRCSCVNAFGELAVCGYDGIFFNTVQDGRTVAVSMKGDKRMIVPCGDYMAIISPAEEDTSDEHIKLVHIQQKIVACSMTAAAPLNVLHCRKEELTGNVVVYVLDGMGILYVLSENGVGRHVDELCKHNLFHQALGMCDRAPEDERAELRARVNLISGDYSFDKRDFGTATEAYINTIGVIQTSHAIQKLLSAQQISHLSVYLRALFDKKNITGEHISLLIHSYVKLNAISELDSLIKDLCLHKVECHFDTEAAIRVLRHTGFTQHALDIAKSYEEDGAYVSMLLRERAAYTEVLEYLRSRPRAQAAQELKNNGKILLQNEPVSTTALLMELCISPQDGSGDDFVADLADFAQIYVDNPQDLRYACEAILAMGAPNSPSRKRLYHTLLEMYLIKSDDSNSGMTNVRAEAAMDLLKRGWTPGHEPCYDADEALTSCRLHSFENGLIFLNLMLRRYRDAISTMARVRDWNAIIDVCQTHGDISQGGDPLVWQDALASLSSPVSIPESEEYLGKLLDIIDERNALPPLTVLSILAKNPDLKFGLVKSYFGRIFESEYECIKEYSEEIDQLNKSIEAQEKILERIESKPRIFQSTKDSQTGAPLELPLVHFMCGHSFNLRTLRDPEDPKCPLCSEEHQRIQAMARSFRAAAVDKDSFFRQLHSSDDAFTFIAEAFGKGYMDIKGGQESP